MKFFIPVAAASLALGALISLPGAVRPAQAALAEDDGLKLEPTPSSAIARVTLPAGAMRVTESTIPASVSDALKSLADRAGSKFRQGRIEVLVWSGVGPKSDKMSGIKSRMSSTMKTSKWNYEESAKEKATGEMTMISAVQTVPTRRGLLGFWAPTDDGLVLAWTEIIPADAVDTESDTPARSEVGNGGRSLKDILESIDPSWPEPVNTPTPAPRTSAEKQPVQVAMGDKSGASAGVAVFTLSANQNTVNVMKNASPKMPAFPSLAVKRNVVRGYVKDTKGRPVKGAVIGVRSSSAGGFYSGTTGKSDANGYYEIAAPWGAAEFYTASYTMSYGDGRAAFGLRPADGEADTFATANGCVENWVIAAYGVADEDAASDQPHYAGNYYGGTFGVSYNVMDSRFPNDADLPDGSEIEITLTPVGPLIDGSTGKTIVIRRPITESGRSSFYVNNVPVGQYRVTGKMIKGGGGRLKFRESGPMQARPFGLDPKEGNDVVLTFRPGGAKSGMAAAQHGNWEQLDFTVSR